MPQNFEILPTQLKWDNDVPLSSMHNEAYFSLKNGLAESQYVFIEANNLSSKFKQNDTSSTAPFTIVETGFGAGLNFLATYQLWLALPNPKKPLHFISIEKYPLSKNDLVKCLDLWPTLKMQSTELIQAYPELIHGQHQIDLALGKVKLTLIFSDVLDALKRYSFNCDCWFLDGFSPTKDPSIWSEVLFNSIALHSHQHTCFSTFSDASNIEKGLLNAGFNVEKISSYRKKRKMFYGTFRENSHRKAYIENWLLPDKQSNQNNLVSTETDKAQNSNLYDAIVLGAGLAGISTAKALADQGLKVAVIDQNAAPVLEASGQAQLAMYAKLPSEKNKISQFITHCLAYSQRYYRGLQQQARNSTPTNNAFWHPSGLLQVAWNEKEAIKQQRFLSNCAFPDSFIESVSSTKASTLSGLNLSYSGLWFPACGWLSPSPYAEFCLTNPNIDCYFNTQIHTLNWNESDKNWSARSKEKTFSATHLVIANSNQAKSFKQLEHLPTKAIRGQLSAIKNTSLIPCKTVICGEGYLCPSQNEWFSFGATFDLHNKVTSVTEKDLALNIRSLQTWLPDWLSEEAIKSSRQDKQIKNTLGFRCTTPDYMPIVGQVPIYNEMIERFASLRQGATKCQDTYGSYYPNLYINIGHGSKGVYSTPLAAELIRAQICGGALPVSNEQLKMLSPARFIIKHLKQRRI